MRAISLIIFLTFLFACEKEPELSVDDPAKENPFEEYVQRFYDEAKSRGLNLDRGKLTVKYMDENSEYINAGYCGYGYFNFQNSGRHQVEIYPSPNCWDEREDMEKESLMFHELGHAVLGQFHRNVILPNGIEKSMMCGLPSSCNQFALYSKYTPKLRAYYIEELFNANTPTPEWAEEKVEKRLFFSDPLYSDTSQWTFFTSGPGAPINFSGEQTTQNSGALRIQAKDQVSPNQFAGWVRDFPYPNLSEGSSLELKVIITTDNLIGRGGSILIRTKSGGENSISGLVSTEVTDPIKGNLSRQEIKLLMPYTPDQVHLLQVYLLMQSNSFGDIYFENVEINVLK